MKKLSVVLCAVPLLAGAADLYLAGDSTMCPYPSSQAPQMGWGPALTALVKPGVQVTNLAAGGLSSRSFLTEKNWDRILKSAKPGDFVIIQFGHNDAHRGPKNLYRSTFPRDTFQLYLRIYIAEARANGLIPVLCTRTALCLFRDGRIEEKRADYIDAVRKVAQETGCSFVDLNAFAHERLAALGPSKAEKLYMCLAKGEDPRVPEGRTDRCHLRDAGAEFYAKGFVELARKQKLLIADLFR